MNKKLLAVAVAAAAMPMVAQAGGPTLYGKINVTIEQVENDRPGPVFAPTNNGTTVNGTLYSRDSKAVYMNSNASRLGVKGDVETNITGLTGIYQAEYAIDADDGATPFSQRNIFLGLKGPFGALKLGKMDTPLKEAQGKVDEFNDQFADIAAIMPGEVRANNSIAYESPKLAESLTFKVSLIPAEYLDIDNEDNDANVNTDQEDSIADSYSASLTFENGPLYAAIAADKNISGSGNVDGFDDIDSTATGTQSVADTMRAVFAYKADSFEVGALFQTSEDVSGDAVDEEDTATLLSGAYMMGDWKFKAQYGVGEGQETEDEKTMTAVGVEYKIGKSTMAFAHYAQLEVDLGAPASTDYKLTDVAVGLEQKF